MDRDDRDYVVVKHNMTAGEMLMYYLRLEGVDRIFGVPGGALMDLLNTLKSHRDEIDYVICRQKTGAAYMADGYHRATGKLGVTLVTSGPGATNALTGVMNAHSSNSAMLAITGEVNEDYFGKGYLQEGVDASLDVNAIYHAATQFSSVVTTAANFQTLFSQAMRDALTAPGHGVHISVPNNVTTESLERVSLPASPENYRALAHGVNETDVQIAMQCLSEAKRPLILVGNGCRDALSDPETSSMFRNLVETYAIPVISSSNGKGLFPESHDLSLRVFGLASCQWPHFWFNAPKDEAPYDALLVIGSSLSEFATNKWDTALVPQGPFIQVNLDPHVIGRGYHVSHGVVADAGAFIAGMSALRDAFPPDANLVKARRDAVAAIKSNNDGFVSRDDYNSDSAPFQPAALMRVLQNTLPSETMIIMDAGNGAGWTLHYLEVSPPMQIHYALTMGPMGFGTAAIVGAKMGRPETTCVCVTGDASFMMQGSEVSTAKRNRAGAIWFVLFDDNLGMVSQGMAHFKGDAENPDIWDELYDLGAPDLAMYARGLGAEGYIVNSPPELEAIMPGVLAGANERNIPQVVVVNVARDTQPPYYDNPLYVHAEGATRNLK